MRDFSRWKTELCHQSILLQQYSKKLEAFNEHHRTLQKPRYAQRQEVAFAFHPQMHDILHNQH